MGLVCAELVGLFIFGSFGSEEMVFIENWSFGGPLVILGGMGNGEKHLRCDDMEQKDSSYYNDQLV